MRNTLLITSLFLIVGCKSNDRYCELERRISRLETNTIILSEQKVSKVDNFWNYMPSMPLTPQPSQYFWTPGVITTNDLRYRGRGIDFDNVTVTNGIIYIK